MRGRLHNEQREDSFPSSDLTCEKQLQSSHNDTNYWLVNGQLSLECSAGNAILENGGGITGSISASLDVR
ncbi:hypothetical protein VZT92_021891 [Zoarces viviparus]|uniref:Uncharacterized protein n=1 Tax=Zoarces viviparus TaxID=48416 RepID=A0AAW1EA42_ZOAVI